MTDQQKRIEELSAQALTEINRHATLTINEEEEHIFLNGFNCGYQSQAKEIEELKLIISGKTFFDAEIEFKNLITRQQQEIEELKVTFHKISTDFQNRQNELVEEKASLITELTRLRSLNEELKEQKDTAESSLEYWQDKAHQLSALL